MEEDRRNGLLPFFVSTTVGTTSCCSADNIKDIGPICDEFDVWLHVDAAYAGSAMICPELRHLFEGVEVGKPLSFSFQINRCCLKLFHERRDRLKS